jgi:hypothetical protein
VVAAGAVAATVAVIALVRSALALRRQLIARRAPHPPVRLTPELLGVGRALQQQREAARRALASDGEGVHERP